MSLYEFMMQSWEGIAIIAFCGGIMIAAFLLPVCDACLARREAIKKFFKDLFGK